MARLLIIDQNLKGFEGHHYEYDLTLIESASRLGVGVLIAAHSKFAGKTLGQAPVVGHFSGDWRDATHSPVRAALWGGMARLPNFARHSLIRLAVAQRRRKQNDSIPANTALAEELVAILAHAGLHERDHVLIHTLGESELLGLGERLADEGAPSPHFHIVLRYDGTSAATQAFNLFNQSPANVRFWTDTEQLAEHYRALGCSEIGVLPIPHGLPARARRERKEGRTPLTLAYLGGARGDKGFHLLPDLVAALADAYLATGRARFLVQTNYSLSREESIMMASKRRLAKFPRQWIELIGQPLDSPAFHTKLLASDIMLLPYDREIYQRRSSGLLVKAMVAGIPTIVPEGTWLAGEAPAGACVVFEGEANFTEAVQRAIEDYGALESIARGAMAAAGERHDAEMLVERIMSRHPRL